MQLNARLKKLETRIKNEPPLMLVIEDLPTDEDMKILASAKASRRLVVMLHGESDSAWLSFQNEPYPWETGNYAHH